MLAEIVLIQQLLLHPPGRGGQHHRVPVHKRHFFQHYCVVDRLHGVLAPGEGTVAVHQHRRDIQGVDTLEGLDNDAARLPLVFPGDFIRGHLSGAGDIPIEIVPLGGAHGRDVSARLGKGGGPAAVGVDHAAHCGKGFVQLHMGGGVAGRSPRSLCHLAVQVHHHQVLRRHALVGHAGGLDDHQAALPVDSGHVAPGEGHQAVFWQQKVGLQDLLF